MKIENQVAAVEQCQKLEALGVEYNRPAYHWIFDSGMRWKLHPLDYYNLHEEGIEYHPAFTVAELGVMLPMVSSEKGKQAHCWKTHGKYGWSMYEDGYIQLGFAVRFEPTEAQARAAMLIYLLENNQIPVDEVNQRLHQ